MDVDAIFSGPAVTLEQVLDSRSRRAERQRATLADGAVCRVSFTLNIPGNIKRFPLARAAVAEGRGLLRTAFGPAVLKEETVDGPTGSEALLALDADPAEIKRKTVAMEDGHPLGRLFDMDVLDTYGLSLSRTDLGAAQRACLVCGRSAKICGRSRAHSIGELRIYIGQLLEDYFKKKYADECQSAALRAMLSEVSTTPKPGLVDRNNSGSHPDMDFFTFVDSAAALAPHFRRMFLAGWGYASEDPADLFTRLRRLGQDAESAMFAATRGVNTHKALSSPWASYLAPWGSGDMIIRTSPSIQQPSCPLPRKWPAALSMILTGPATTPTACAATVFITFLASGARPPRASRRWPKWAFRPSAVTSWPVSPSTTPPS